MAIKKFENFKPDTEYCDGEGSEYVYFGDLKAFGFRVEKEIDLVKYIIDEILKPDFELEFEEYCDDVVNFWFLSKAEEFLMCISELPDFHQSLVQYLIDKEVILYIEDDIDYENSTYHYFLKDSFSLDVEETIVEYKKYVLEEVENIHKERMNWLAEESKKGELEKYNNLLKFLKKE